MALATAFLAWKDPDLTPGDYEQIALQLIGHAHTVAADVRRLVGRPAQERRPRRPRRNRLREADGRLSAPLKGTACCVQNRARLVWALYTPLDRLTEPAQATA